MKQNPFLDRLRLVVAALLALAAWNVIAPPARAGVSDAVKYAKLPNDLQVIVLENHKAPVATLNVFFHVGSRNEETGKTGISHLLEHLMFRGTKKYGPEEFSNIISENGGEDNAFTTEDYRLFRSDQPRPSRRANRTRGRPDGEFCATRFCLGESGRDGRAAAAHRG